MSSNKRWKKPYYKKYIGEKYSFQQKSNKTIGPGGNSKVYDVEILDSSLTGEYVVKVFSCKEGQFRERYSRFCREVEFLKNNDTIPGIMPLIDKHCPEKKKRYEAAWYLLPKADQYPSEKSRTLQEILEQMILLGKTLQQLHEKGAAHRDIKPENILFYKDRLFLIDYGLLWIAGEERLTIQEERIGPYKILPPELTRVIRKNEKIDFRASDVYLFAKVLWMYINRNNEGFSGPYLRSREMVYLQLNSDYSNETKTLEPIHQLLEKATLDDWEKRISIKECIDYMQLQLDIIRNNNSPLWKTKISNLVYTENLHYVIAHNEPTTREFSSLDTILKMLSGIIEQSSAMIIDAQTKEPIGNTIMFSSFIPDKENGIILRHNPGFRQIEQFRLCHVIMRYTPGSEIIELIPGDPSDTKTEDEIYYSNKIRNDNPLNSQKYLLTPNEIIILSKKTDNIRN